MNISKFNNYIKISGFSEEVDDLEVANIKVTGNINCCQQNCEDLISEYTLPVTEDPSWAIDLTEAVNLRAVIQVLNIQSIYSLIKYNALTSPVDLATILDSCAGNNCTVEDHAGTYGPLIKNAVDAWFASIGVSSNVTVTFVGNIMTVANTPVGFTLYSAEYGSAAPYTIIPFGFTVADSNIYYDNTPGSKALYIKPEFFNDNTAFVDGIYKFTVRFIKENDTGYIQEENCSFIDITTKCRVASVLQNLLKESEQKSTEPVSTIIHLLHYSLVNGSDCACNCDNLCDAYKGLIDLLDTIDPKIVNDCGC